MKETTKLIRKIMAADIKIKVLEKEMEGLIISRDVVLEILKELTDEDHSAEKCADEGDNCAKHSL